MMTKSSLRRASQAARTLPTISATGTVRLPSRCPHRFGLSWSSRWMPATPARSKARTVRTTFTALPKPVSASQNTGTSTTSTMRPAFCTNSSSVPSAMSGTPRWAFTVPAPVM